MEENKMKKSKFEKLVDKIRNGIGVPKAVLSMPRHEAKLALGYAVTHGARSLARNAVLGLAGVMALAGCGQEKSVEQSVKPRDTSFDYLGGTGREYTVSRGDRINHEYFDLNGDGRPDISRVVLDRGLEGQRVLFVNNERREYYNEYER